MKRNNREIQRRFSFKNRHPFNDHCVYFQSWKYFIRRYPLSSQVSLEVWVNDSFFVVSNRQKKSVSKKTIEDVGWGWVEQTTIRVSTHRKEGIVVNVESITRKKLMNFGNLFSKEWLIGEIDVDVFEWYGLRCTNSWVKLESLRVPTINLLSMSAIGGNEAFHSWWS